MESFRKAASRQENTHVTVQEEVCPAVLATHNCETNQPSTIETMQLLRLEAQDLRELNEKSKELLQTPERVHRMCKSRLETSRHFNSKFIWNIAAHDTASVIERLSEGPPSRSEFEEMQQAREEERCKLLFVFSGQGSALEGWWLEEYDNNCMFRAALDRICHQALSEHEVDLRNALRLDNRQQKEVPSALQQPAIYAVQVALTEAWAKCAGAVPDVVIGHSFGEFAAAVAAGALSWEQGLAMVIKRGALMAELPATGGMLAVFQSKSETETMLKKANLALTVACQNAPAVIVLSGSTTDIDKAEHVLHEEGVGFRRLETKHAFHSPQMQPVVHEFGAAVQGIMSSNAQDSPLEDQREAMELHQIFSRASTSPMMSEQTDDDVNHDMIHLLDGSKAGMDASDFRCPSQNASCAKRSLPRFVSTVTTKAMSAEELRSAEYWTAHVEAPVRFEGAMQAIDARSCATVVEIGPSASMLGLIKRCVTERATPAVLTASLGNPRTSKQAAGFCRAVEQVLMSPWGMAQAEAFQNCAELGFPHNLDDVLGRHSQPERTEGLGVPKNMLGVINELIHGYVCVPVLLSVRKRGLFSLLSQEALTLQDIGRRLSCSHVGHLAAAMRMLESMQVVLRGANGEYSLIYEEAAIHSMPQLAVDLYSMEFKDILHNCSAESKWLAAAEQRWGLQDPSLAALFDGCLYVPLLLALAQQGCFAEDSGTLAGVSDGVMRALALKGWIATVGNEAQLTEQGKYIADRSLNLATMASYRPMLSQIDQVLFDDDWKMVFQGGGLSGAETHVDRALNVQGSGFQHKKFFSAAEKLVLPLFDTDDMSSQPKVILDVGCGSGHFLKRLYDAVCHRTLRGQHLLEHPLTLVGVDYNSSALDETHATLAAYPHFCLPGDIGQPAEMMQMVVEQLGFHKDDILQIRSFLDHDRPFIAPTAQQIPPRVSRETGVFVDEDGHLISCDIMQQNLVDHLSRWAGAVGRHGLALLEVHCMETSVISQHLYDTESLSFDATQSISGQVLTDARSFLRGAAEAGLFATGGTQRFPQLPAYTRITLNHFHKREYCIRPAFVQDLESLRQLEARCWAPKLRASREQVLGRITRNPDGQFVLCVDGIICGVLYTQTLEDADLVDRFDSRQIEDHHQEGAACLLFLGLFIDPAHGHRGFGKVLIDFCLSCASLTSSIRRIIGVSRCSRFADNDFSSLSAYIESKGLDNIPLDPTLALHWSSGAQIQRLVMNYRPSDSENLGAGVLIEYLLTAGRQTVRRAAEERNCEMPNSETAIREVIEDTLLKMLDLPAKELPRLLRFGFMQMGMDSLDLTQFQARLSQLLSITMTSNTLFDFPTVDSLTQHAAAKLGLLSSTKTRTCHQIPQSLRVSDGLTEPLAVVGMACRLPGECNSPDLLWSFLERGGDAMGQIPPSRMDWREWFDPAVGQENKSYTNRGGFISGETLFDNKRFGISPAEATAMDPHQRIALETAHDCMLQAGWQLGQDLSHVGTFVGFCSNDFVRLKQATVSPYTTTGLCFSVIANRISHVYGMSGPSVMIDTACASSLFALHAACTGLQTGDCQAAVVVGVNLMLTMHMYAAFSASQKLSPSGRSAAFCEDADGYARGEGCCAVVLKPLSKALEANDGIWSVVHGTATNQCNRTATLTAPNGPAQEAVIRTAIRRAGISPDDIGFVEAHGTGTKLGDPVEAGALAKVFAGRDKALVVGAVKSNIGHLEGAAGIAGLVKAVLCLHHKRAPPNIHCARLNPRLQPLLQDCPMEFPTQSVELQGMYAGISSFGIGGTNAHAVIGAAPYGTHVPKCPEIQWDRSPFPWRDTPHPFLGPCEKTTGAMVWTCQWSTSTVQYLSNHRVREVPLVPATCYLEIVKLAVDEAFGNVAYELRNVKFESIMHLEEWCLPTVRLTMQSDSDASMTWSITIESAGEDKNLWATHSRMKLFVLKDAPQVHDLDGDRQVEAIMRRCKSAVECGDQFYNSLGNVYGGEFRSLKRAWRGQGEWIGEIDIEHARSDPTVPEFLRSCALLDASAQVPVLGLDDSQKRAGVYADSLMVLHVTGVSRVFHRHVWSHVQSVEGSDTVNVTVYGKYGVVIARMLGLKTGVLEPKVQHGLAVDMWDACPETLQLDHTVEILVPSNVVELHTAVQSRMGMEAPLCVVADSEELAAYVRSVRAEHPSWKLLCVRGHQVPQGVPTAWSEGEMAFRGGAWQVRRLQRVPELALSEHHLALANGKGHIIISGGLGYLGRMVARAMIDQGARNLVLLSSSRSELPTDWEPEVRPAVEHCDVGSQDAVHAVFRKYEDIRGIVHVAGVLSDATVATLTAEDFARVYRPKVDGARNLHDCSKRMDLDFFVMFSSIASAHGAAGQANYAAANGCLDALAEQRVREGLAGLSVRWGAWSGGGMATEATIQRSLASGFLPVDPRSGMDTLLKLMQQPPAAVVTVCPMEPRQLPDSPYLSKVRGKVSGTDANLPRGGQGIQMSEMGQEERKEAIRREIRAQVARVTGAEGLEGSVSWQRAGLDSLSMVELRNALRRQLGPQASLGVNALYEHPCIDALVDHIAQNVQSSPQHAIPEMQSELGPLEAWAPSAQCEEELLVCYQRGNSGVPPIVCVYGWLGLPFGRKLEEHLDASQPLYSLQAPELSDPSYRFSSMVERAADHMQVLADRFGEVGVHLVGYSLGGVLAHEIAALLLEAGISCSLTVLDPAPIVSPFTPLNEIDSQIATLGLVCGAAGLQFNLQELMAGVRHHRSFNAAVAKAAHSPPAARLLQQLSRLGGVMYRHGHDYQAAAATSLQPTLTPHVFILSEGSRFFDGWFEQGWNDDGANGWSNAFGGLTPHFAHGEHLSFFSHDDNVRALGKHLKTVSFQERALPSQPAHVSLETK